MTDNQQPYDSTNDTLAHIDEVRQQMRRVIGDLHDRSLRHDRSKLGPDEKPHFDRETPKLKELVYGSEEYKASLKRLGEALQHHYANNDHHPEHFGEDGVAGMNLMQVVEMFCDWVAASKRNKGGTLNLEASFARFNFDPQLANIFRNTARDMGIPTIDPKAETERVKSE